MNNNLPNRPCTNSNEYEYKSEDMVRDEIVGLSILYIEKNNGKMPDKKQIKEWIKRCLEATNKEK